MLLILQTHLIKHYSQIDNYRCLQIYRNYFERTKTISNSIIYQFQTKNINNIFFLIKFNINSSPMGNDQSREQRTQGMTRKYVNDYHYGGNVIISQITHTVFQQFIIDQKSLPNFLKLINHRKQLIHPHLMTVKSSFSKDQKYNSFNCNNEKKTQVFIQYNYLSKTLEHIIESYNDKGVQIPQKQIINIFSKVVEILRYLKINKTCHGDIKAKNILFDDFGKVFLIDSFFVNGGKSAYEIVMQNPSSMSLLSPEQLERIKNRQLEDLEAIYDNEMYAVGLTMIQTMTYEPAMQFYDLQKLAIKEDYPLKKFEQLKVSGYSSKLIALAMKCISEKRQNRPSFDDFLDHIMRR